ncbi:MAG: hypothetical protein HWN79_12265 [Candidatus Lokiarchaeota archaeon]|nr:hypothetical protein [Candidatus Lokiarchaeota archaeon]
MKKEPLEDFVVDKERVNALKILLEANSEFITSKEKNSIIQAFKVNHYAAFIKLYSREDYVKNGKKCNGTRKSFYS